MNLIERAADHITKQKVEPMSGGVEPFPPALPVDEPGVPGLSGLPPSALPLSPDRSDPVGQAPGPVPQDDSRLEPGRAPGSDSRAPKYIELDPATMQKNRILMPFGPSTQLTEEFRHIKRDVLSLRSVEGVAHANMIMVTSAAPGEGKTHTAINLAMSIASERDLTALLIDVDFTRPQVLARLGVSAEIGLINLLEDPSLDVSDAILRTNIESLSIIPAGPSHQRSTELLASRRMQELASEIATRYSDRIIIFDTAPLLATTEPAVLVRHVGQILVVVEAEKTSKGAINSAVDMIKDHSGIGFVLNKMRPQLGQSLVGGYYNYYNYGYQNKK